MSGVFQQSDMISMYSVNLWKISWPVFATKCSRNSELNDKQGQKVTVNSEQSSNSVEFIMCFKYVDIHIYDL